MDIKDVFGIRIDLAKNFRSRQEPLQNINWIFEKDKKFIVIGNKNSVTYKEIFPYMKKNELWMGL